MDCYRVLLVVLLIGMMAAWSKSENTNFESKFTIRDLVW